MVDEQRGMPPSDEDESLPDAVKDEEAGSKEENVLEHECAEILAKKDEEARQLQDRVLRMAAEVENTRKRLEREKSEGICFANESLIRDLLPVIDNLERAIEHGSREADLPGLLEGVRMTLKGFSDTLSRFGCVPFDSLGKPFDPNYHEAVMQQESEEVPDMTVVQEFQKGYTLKDRLVRPAMVVVAKSPKE
jgi:molecular chaperone GrpE